MDTNRLINVALAVFAIIFVQSASFAQEQHVPIKELQIVPKKYLDNAVVVEGRLKEVTGSSANNPEFFVEDPEGNRVSVSAWLPFEVPPPMPGNEQYWKESRPQLMGDYLGKRLRLHGRLKANLSSKSPGGSYYVEIRSVEIIQ